MAKVSEPVIKIVIASKPKWLIGLDQKVRRQEAGLNVAGLVVNTLPGRQRVPNPTLLLRAERVNPVPRLLRRASEP